MGRSYINIYIHIIFHVKSGKCEMKEDDLPQIFRYIGGAIRSLSGCAHMVGGRPDHIHILTTLPISVGVSDFVRSIKANTSKWIKGLQPEYQDFSWQEGYGAFSVSESNKEAVVQYIANQKEHHQHRTARDEFIHFLKKNGLSVDYVPW